jgi:hypothetical protein
MPKNYNIRNGIQIGMGFCVGWFLAKFIGLIVVVVVGFLCVGEVLWGDEFEAKYGSSTRQPVPAVLETPIRVTYDKGCWIRAHPTTKSKKVGVIKAGDTVTVINARGHWLQTANGWIGCSPAGEAPAPKGIEI